MSARAATGNLYEELYARHNYHGFSRFTTGTTVARVVTQDLKRFATNHGVLDVGCSHGRLVQLMWMGGVKASGVDVSATAIKSARKRLSHRERRCAPDNNAESCFQAAPATALPFADGAFDGIVSSDMLEHLLPSEVPLAISEFSRVAATLPAPPDRDGAREEQGSRREAARELKGVRRRDDAAHDANEPARMDGGVHGSRLAGDRRVEHHGSKWLLLLLTRPNDEVGNVRPKLSGSLRFGPFANRAGRASIQNLTDNKSPTRPSPPRGGPPGPTFRAARRRGPTPSPPPQRPTGT